MKETKEQLLKRHERELEEWKKRYLRENLVTLQTSNYSGEAPYSIQITFPLGLEPQETSRMCNDLHVKIEEWLGAFGYGISWLKPKSEEERAQEFERIQALKRDLPLTVQSELFDIIDKTLEVGPDGWPQAAHRGFEKIWQVLRVMRGAGG